MNRQAYTRDGYCLLPDFLREADLGLARGAFDELDTAAGVPEEYEPEYDTHGGVRRLRKLRRLLWNRPALWGPLLNRCGVGALARQLIGPDATVVFHAAFLKPARIGTPVALHQDQALWRHQYPGAFSVWIALSEVSPANGGLFGCPGSHAAGLVAHRDRPGYPWHPSLDAAEDGLAGPVQFTLGPGDAVLWDRYFAHGSGANTSAHDRRGMVVVFADAAQPDFTATDSMSLGELAALGTGLPSGKGVA